MEKEIFVLKPPHTIGFNLSSTISYFYRYDEYNRRDFELYVRSEHLPLTSDFIDELYNLKLGKDGNKLPEYDNIISKTLKAVKYQLGKDYIVINENY